MLLTYKYRIKDRTAAKRLREISGGCNQVWNWCVAYQRDLENRYRLGAPMRKWPTYYQLSGMCKGVGVDLGILQQSAAAVCRQFVQTRSKERRAPRFRSSVGPRRSLGWVPLINLRDHITGNSVFYRGRSYRWFGNKRRPLPRRMQGGCFVEDARGRWYICILVEVEGRPTEASNEIGIDLGLKALATTSAGTVIQAPRIYHAYERKLAAAQRAGKKQQVRRIHAKIGNCRMDFLHKASTALVRDHGLIAVGDVSGAKLAKTRMAKSVLDAGWSTFRTMLSYKSQQAGVSFVVVDEKFTTQTCSSCGSLPPERPRGIAGLGIREWDCSACGVRHDRDVNAARNILALGRSAAPRADGSWRASANGCSPDKLEEDETCSTEGEGL